MRVPSVLFFWFLVFSQVRVPYSTCHELNNNMLGRNTLLRVSVFCDIVSFPKCASWSENNTEPLLPQKSPALLLRQPFQPWAWGLEDEFREVGCCPTGKVWVPQRLHKTFSGLGSPSGPAWGPRLSGAVKGAEGIPIWAQPSPVVFSGLVQWPLATSTLSTRFFLSQRPSQRGDITALD